MSELAEFVRHGASRITPREVQEIYRKLPLLKVSIAEIQAPQFPHLVDQLQFLANLIEDFVEKKAEDIPYVALASAAFAILYAQRGPRGCARDCGVAQERVRGEAHPGVFPEPKGYGSTVILRQLTPIFPA